MCTWLEDFGLAQYVIFARQWVTSGHTLLTATPQDMEKVRAEPWARRLLLLPKPMHGKMNSPHSLPPTTLTTCPHVGTSAREAKILSLWVDPRVVGRGLLHPLENLHPDTGTSESWAACRDFTSVSIFHFQELGIKHPLHRKKLVLAVKAINTKQEEKSALLDHIWVTRKDRQMCLCFWQLPGNVFLKGSCLLGIGRQITNL